MWPIITKLFVLVLGAMLVYGVAIPWVLNTELIPGSVNSVLGLVLGVAYLALCASVATPMVKKALDAG